MRLGLYKHASGASAQRVPDGRALRGFQALNYSFRRLNVNSWWYATSGFIFNEKPIQTEEGDGASVYDDSGTEYLDVGAGHACVPIGHHHDAVDTAVKNQLDRITCVQASYPNSVRTELYERLADTALDPIDKTWPATRAQRPTRQH